LTAPAIGARHYHPAEVRDSPTAIAAPLATDDISIPSDPDYTARLLVSGIRRLLQHRAEASIGDLPLAELAYAFEAHWNVPFSLQPTGVSDVVTLLQMWPHKVVLHHDGTQYFVRLPRHHGLLQEEVLRGAQMGGLSS